MSNETQKDNLLQDYLTAAPQQTMDSLDGFLKNLQAELGEGVDQLTSHGLMVAGAIATLMSLEKANDAQHGPGINHNILMWVFLKQWRFKNNECGLKILEYDDFLSKKKLDEFPRVLPTAAWENIKKKAAQLYKDSADEPLVPRSMRQFWKSIARGNLPTGFKIKDPKMVVLKEENSDGKGKEQAQA